MTIKIYAPGIDVKITDSNKNWIVCDIIESIMNSIFYENELCHDVISIHNDKSDCIAEVILKPNPENGFLKGFTVNNRWYCLPDAKDVVKNIILEMLG